MSTVDWPTIDPNAVDGENTSDLFGGDLFGDELLDMYNSSVTEITNILPGKATDELSNKHSTTVDYDGLGDFRHSTSFNDFTSILENKINVLPSPARILQTATNSVDPQPACLNLSSTSSFSEGTSGSKRGRASENSVLTIEPVTKKQQSNQSVVSNTTEQQKDCEIVKTESGVVGTKSCSNVHPQANNSTGPQRSGMSLHPAATASSSHLATCDPTVRTNNPPNVVSTIVKSSPSPVVTTQSVVNKGNQIVANASKIVSVNQTTEINDEDIKTEVGATSVKTEESFKGVAQAAVTNLIMSAGNNSTTSKEDIDQSFAKPVDTSTAHVAALTSNNWVAACAASISGAPPGSAQAAQAAALAAASDPAAAKAARARRATLTADERARQNRDRNREHARNTRLRKKAYVEELKRTLTELVTQRDAAELERRHEKQRDHEVREVRYRVMEEFLKLRARGSEQNLLARWVAILEEGFTFSLPLTEYRPMVQSQLSLMTRRVSTSDTSVVTNATAILDSSTQVLHGASQCLDDATLVSSLMSSIFQGDGFVMSYHCERVNFMMDGVKAMLDWSLKVTPQTQGIAFDISQSFVLKGCMRATFSPASNKLAYAEFIFDTGFVKTQVNKLKVQHLCPIAETDALLDSVLPQVSTMSTNNRIPSNAKATLPSSVSVVSTDKESSDEEGVPIKTEHG